ncbi:hypothetical protein [Streptomyces sp. Isolate_45]|uniref:hypothetical protein n=1 Tax=Streptomyces sp. Isolate_45 TaxID=2950111 RepID=UPI002481F1C8|nr:hypothetical protein [Streptomyces sp. Isolate_45]MDA5280974.1 hypothetical protein [Streptomyces sp. Isolate_45]
MGGEGPAAGLILGTAALSTAFLGLQALLGMVGFALGGALMMRLGEQYGGQPLPKLPAMAPVAHWRRSAWKVLLMPFTVPPKERR